LGDRSGCHHCNLDHLQIDDVTQFAGDIRSQFEVPAMTDQCPICKSKAIPLGRTGDAMGFDCPEHNKFKVSDTVLSLLRAKTREQWEAALAKAKQRTKPGEWPLVTSYDFL
jgi:hypothetical protein